MVTARDGRGVMGHFDDFRNRSRRHSFTPDFDNKRGSKSRPNDGGEEIPKPTVPTVNCSLGHPAVQKVTKAFATAAGNIGITFLPSPPKR